MTRTRAAVWHGDGRLELGDWELGELGPRDVLVDVDGCGVCGSDLHVLDGGFPGLKPPVVLGHEPAGRVAAVGAEVAAFAPGDAVTWEPNTTCGRCFYCRDGQDANLCERRTRISGSFAAHTRVPERALHRLPAGVETDVAVLAEPLSCALYAFDRGDVRLGQTVAIVGAGSIGLLVLALVARAGVRAILVSDPNPFKREMALRLGAHAAVDPADGFAAATAELTGGRGFDVAFECVGAPRTVTDTLALARPGGRAVLVGVPRAEDRVPLDVLSLQQRDLTVAACNVRRHTYQRAVQLLAVLPLAGLVTHHVALDDVGEAVRLLRDGEAVKAVVVP